MSVYHDKFGLGGMDGMKNGKNGDIKFLSDIEVSYGHIFKKGGVENMRYWPDMKRPDVIWWNQGQGYWYWSVIGKDVEILDSNMNEGLFKKYALRTAIVSAIVFIWYVLITSIVGCSTEGLHQYNVEGITDNNCYSKFGGEIGYCEE